MSTEAALRDWRFGSIQAERLAAAILDLEGFADIDPQATLGGGDDKKDIIARRDGQLWIGAVHFPPSDKDFAAIKRKFKDDYNGVARHNAEGFAFFVNKHLTMGERFQLNSLATVRTELYHLERMRHILDIARGYGLRLEYLRIEMTKEEQIAFIDQQRRDFSVQIAALREFPDKPPMEALARTISAIQQTVSEAFPRTATTSIDVSPHLLSARIANSITSLAELNIGDLRMLHRELTDELPWANGGQLRLVNVWIGSAGEMRHVLPSPHEVPQKIEAVLAGWRQEYPALVDAETWQIIRELARLHVGITAVHPFLDGNGRLARALLDLAAQDLLGCHVGPALTEDAHAYYESLRLADSGDLTSLVHVIEGSLLHG